MHIRPAMPHEAALLGALACQSKQWWGYDALQIEIWREELSPSAASIALQPTYVAEVDGVAAGFCQLNLEEGATELKNLWVLPRFMRQGIGRALLRRASAEAAARGIAGLAINADPHAEAFYLGQGAQRVGTEPAPIPGQPGRVLPQLLLPTAA